MFSNFVLLILIQIRLNFDINDLTWRRRCRWRTSISKFINKILFFFLKVWLVMRYKSWSVLVSFICNRLSQRDIWLCKFRPILLLSLLKLMFLLNACLYICFFVNLSVPFRSIFVIKLFKQIDRSWHLFNNDNSLGVFNEFLLYIWLAINVNRIVSIENDCRSSAIFI